MNNKLYFLGTGGDEQVISRLQRGSAGIVLQLEGFQFHLDPGPGSLNGLFKNKLHPRETIAVIATNNSLLRANDVNAVLMAMTIGGLDKHGVFLASKSVIEGSDDNPAMINNYYKECVEGLLALTPSNRVGVNNVNFMPTKTQGLDNTAVGLKISFNNNSIGYTGDTGYFEGLAKEFEGVNVLIINCKNPSNIKDNNFLNIDDAKKLIGEVKPKLAILTSFGSKLLEKDVLAQGRDLQRETNTTVVMAKDTLQINLDDYSDKVKKGVVKGYE